jgi:hypothetical protein
MYLIKWREEYITNYTEEAVACRAIEEVKRAYEQSDEKLKKGIYDQHKDRIILYPLRTIYFFGKITIL